MKNLLEQIQKRTKSNLVKVTTKKNICDHLHDMLLNKELDRYDDIIPQISLKRLQNEFPDLKDDSVLTEKQLKRLDSIMITVKNGVDTAVCNGKTASSYCSNPQYKDFELIKNGSKLKIQKKSNK